MDIILGSAEYEIDHNNNNDGNGEAIKHIKSDRIIEKCHISLKNIDHVSPDGVVVIATSAVEGHAREYPFS